MSEFQTKVNAQLKILTDQINSFFSFVGEKLKNYKNLTLGEQVAYPTIGVGLVLILTSLVLFII
jgi:hypothetical protein